MAGSPAQPDRRIALLSGTHTIEEAEAITRGILSGPPVDTRDRLHNAFFHEFWPLTLISRHVGALTFTFSGLGPDIDGELHLPSGAKQFVEMTAAVDGQDESLRMEMLRQFGRAPAFGKIEATGTKNRGRKFSENDNHGGLASEHDDGVLFPLMRDKLKAKQLKAKSRPHYSTAWLGIVFVDHPPDLEYRQRRFDPLAKRVLDLGYSPFSRAFCVGRCWGNYLFDSATITPSRASSNPP